MPSKPFKYALKSRRPKAKPRKKPEGYVAPPSPKDRCTPWVSVTMRAEHYAMLREIAEYFEAPVSKVTATMVVQQYCRLLREVEPVTAQKIIETYKEDERHEGQLLDLIFDTWEN